MPTYQYKRQDGTEFEWFQGMNEPKLTHCPETGQKVKLKFTAPNLSIPPFHVTKYDKTKHLAKLKDDPLYTTLDDYKENVGKLREETKTRDKSKIQIGHK